MLKVGLTGGIGSGKTTVSKILINLGLPVYNSDQRAKWLMNNDPSLRIDELMSSRQKLMNFREISMRILDFRFLKLIFVRSRKKLL